MESISSTQYTWRKCIISIIVLLSLQRAAKSENNGILTFEFICYRNPDHLDKSGKKCDSIPSVNCDPYFTICISNQRIDGDIKIEKCGIYYQQTVAYNNHDLVCKTPTDNRGSLQNIITKEIELRRNNVIHVKIDAKDEDQYTSYQTPIASFSAELTSESSLSFQKITYRNIKMFRNEFRYANPQVSMNIRMGLQCKPNRYGQFCQTFCPVTKLSTCSDVGEKICKEGWKGNDCQLQDYCISKLCAKDATCKETATGAECICNGQSGPECYPDYNPCNPNPCQNEGLCIPNKIKRNNYRCSCYFPFVGSKCENEMCTFEPCYNNASCFYDENNIRRCNCTLGFNGLLCEQKINNQIVGEHLEKSNIKQPKSNFLIILMVSFGYLFVIFVIAVIFFIKKRKQKSNKDKKCSMDKITMSSLEKLTKNNSEIDNVYSKSSLERDYETVEEMVTYAYLNDYLIPSTKTDTPDYLVLSCNSDSCTIENEPQDPFELPELPSREFKRKFSLTSFCRS